MRNAMMMTICVAMLTGLLAVPAAAEPPKLGEGKGTVTLSWDEFVKITGYDPTKKSSTITVPWEEIRTLLNVEVKGIKPGTTIDLPWQEFKALLDWHVKQQTPKVTPPPAEYIVTAAEYAGKIGEKSATFTLALKLTILREKGWKRIPVLPGNVAIVSSTMQPADGVYLNAASGRYELLTEKSGAVEAAIEFSVNVTKSAGINRVQFDRAHPGSSVLDLEIDQPDVDVKVAGAQSQMPKPVPGKTAVAAAIPSGTPVQVTWERALPEVAKVPPKLYAETRALVAVGDDMLLCRETVNYNILHTPVRGLKLSVPAGVSVLTVSGGNVQDWRVDAANNELSVILRGEAIGAYALHISYERTGKGDAEVPVIRPAGVERERGYVGVVALTNVELSAGAIEGAAQIDARRLPADIAAMTNQPILLAFRYVGERLSLPLLVKKHEEIGVLVTIADSAMFTGMQLNDGRRMTKAVYSVRNNRNQFLRMRMPATAEIWSVSVGGNPVSPARDEQGNVLLPLIRSASASQELTSFPVEIVYVETPAAVAPERGTLHVELPTCYVPVMHVMYSFYAPAEGDYTVGWGRPGFSGPMELVEGFAEKRAEGAAVVQVDAQAQAQQMAEQFEQRAQAAVTAAGATPIRVRLPVNGKLFRLEKLLALPQDKLFFDVAYRGWRADK